MTIKTRTYYFLIAIHVLIGVLIYLLPSLSKLYNVAIFLVGMFFVAKYRDYKNISLLFCAYIVGVEVFLRMTQGSFFYETSKYGVIIFMIMGMYYNGFSKNAIPFWIYLLLLLPSVVVATQTLNLDTDVRKSILFNISGPLCLGISAIYCYNKRISFEQISNVLLFAGLPIITTTVYLILFTPDLKEIIVNTNSNVYTSGGFGPNQVSTILGLGMFVFFSRAILNSPSKTLFFVNIFIALNITYRALLTFSRGGVITAIVLLLLLILMIYLKSGVKARLQIVKIIGIFAVISIIIWTYTSLETGGLIEKRYANEDAKGRKKESQLTGREEIFESEYNSFLENPILGIGVGKGKEVREEETGGLIIASHNEVTRTLAEHGSLGILGLLIVFFTPIILYIDNRQNIFIFCFLFFWLLTINHAAMRIAAPAFIYALSVLKVIIHDENPLHRKPTD